MVNPQLTDYISNERLKGFTDDQIKQALIQNGYDQKTIDEAFFKPTTTNTKFNLKPILIGSLVLFGVLLIIALFLFTRNLVTDSSEKLLHSNDVKPTLNFKQVDATNPLEYSGSLVLKRGETTPFLISFYNSKSEDAYDVRPSIQNCKDSVSKKIEYNIILVSKSGIVASDSKFDFNSSIKVIDVFPGIYNCELIVDEIKKELEIKII